MNHTAITGNLSQYIPDMKATHDADPKITFLLGETNSDYVNLDMAQVEGVFGSSLWLLDYLLYGMSLVSHTPLSKYNRERRANEVAEYQPLQSYPRNNLRVHSLGPSGIQRANTWS